MTSTGPTEKFVDSVLKAILVLIYVGCFSVTISLHLFTYDIFISKLASLTGHPGYADLLKSRLSLEKFNLLKISSIILFIILLGIAVIFAKRYKKILATSTRIVAAAARSFTGAVQHNLPRGKEKKALFLLLSIFAVRACFYNWWVPLQHDEMWTYNYFINGSLWQSFLLPGNNHKAFTFIAWFFNASGFNAQQLIRLPCTIAAMCCIVAAFVWLRKYFSFAVTILASTWLASSVPVGVYATTARSYIFVLLFSILLTHIVTSVMESSKVKPGSFFWLMVVTIFGYWSNPVFFFPHFFICFYFLLHCIFNNRMAGFFKFAKAMLVAAAVVVLLYVPDFVGGHFTALMDVAFPNRASQSSFLTVSLNGNGEFYFGFKKMGWLLLLLPTILLLIGPKKFSPVKNVLFLSAFNIALISWWAYSTRTDLSFHLCIFLTIYVAFLIGILFAKINSVISLKYVLPVFCTAIFTWNSYLLQQSSWFLWSYEQDKSAIKANSWLLQNDAVKVYNGYDYFKPALIFYSTAAGHPLTITMSSPASIEYSATVNEDTDVIIENAEAPLSNLVKSGFSLQFSVAQVRIYTRNNLIK